jgi:hypothetical protein
LKLALLFKEQIPQIRARVISMDSIKGGWEKVKASFPALSAYR